MLCYCESYHTSITVVNKIWSWWSRPTATATYEHINACVRFILLKCYSCSSWCRQSRRTTNVCCFFLRRTVVRTLLFQKVIHGGAWKSCLLTSWVIFSILQLVYIALVYYFIMRKLLFNQGWWRSNVRSDIYSGFEDWSAVCRWPLAFCRFETFVAGSLLLSSGFSLWMVLRCPGGNGWCAVGAFHRLTETKVGCGGHHWLFAGRPAPSAIGC